MAWPPGAHASTFGGNPVSCAAALATIALLKDQLVANAADVGAHLMAGLTRAGGQASAHRRRARPRPDDRRRAGARSRRRRSARSTERNAVVDAAFNRGLLVLGAGKNAIRFSPPLVLTTSGGRHRGPDLRRGADRGRERRSEETAETAEIAEKHFVLRALRSPRFLRRCRDCGASVAGLRASCRDARVALGENRRRSRLRGARDAAGTQLLPGATAGAVEKLTSSRATARRWCSSR